MIMDYKEKYEMALERAKKFIEANPLVQNLNTWIKETFPELAESEDERTRKEIMEYVKNSPVAPEGHIEQRVLSRWLAWLEKQDKQKSQRMISAEAKEAMYDKPADTVEQKCEESKTKVFDAPTSFEDKLYAFVLACEILVDPSKREFILEHSQEILDAAREQIGKEQSSAWSKEEEVKINRIVACLENLKVADNDILLKDVDWLKSLKTRYTWKPSEEQLRALHDINLTGNISYAGQVNTLIELYNNLKKL